MPLTEASQPAQTQVPGPREEPWLHRSQKTELHAQGPSDPLTAESAQAGPTERRHSSQETFEN